MVGHHEFGWLSNVSYLYLIFESVTTWEGDINNVDQTSLAEKRAGSRDFDEEDDDAYNKDFDQGRVRS